MFQTFIVNQCSKLNNICQFIVEEFWLDPARNPKIIFSSDPTRPVTRYVLARPDPWPENFRPDLPLMITADWFQGNMGLTLLLISQTRETYPNSFESVLKNRLNWKCRIYPEAKRVYRTVDLGKISKLWGNNTPLIGIKVYSKLVCTLYPKLVTDDG